MDMECSCRIFFVFTRWLVGSTRPTSKFWSWCQ